MANKNGAHPGFTQGFTQGLGNAWSKQIGRATLRTRKCTKKRTPQGLQDHARREWQYVKKLTGCTMKYTLHLGVRRSIELSSGLVIYIDRPDGSYNYNWSSVAIRLIRRAS